MRMKWAVVGTGNIVKKFIVGLRHAEGAELTTVVSRSLDKAGAFAAEHNIEYASDNYDAVLEDPSIDIIYIGTPHSTHMDYAIRALNAHKAVLCEKPVTINRKEVDKIISCAKENNTFFMEAMWTRFFPVMRKVREWLDDGLIGDVRHIEADFGFNVPWNPEGRLLNINLGGGSLLDACVYPIAMAQMVFKQKPEKIIGTLDIGVTDVDEKSNVLLNYGDNRTASLSAALTCPMQNDCRIYGTLGRITIPDFVFARKATLTAYGKYDETYSPEFKSNGYNYEAEEVMNCVKNRDLESRIMPWQDSSDIMDIMDDVRRQNNFYYPCEEKWHTPRTPS